MAQTKEPYGSSRDSFWAWSLGRSLLRPITKMKTFFQPDWWMCDECKIINKKELEHCRKCGKPFNGD